MSQRILVAGQLEVFSQRLKDRLVKEGFEVIEAAGLEASLRVLQEHYPGLAIVGPAPDGRGDAVEMLARLRRHDSKVPMILITRSSSETQAISALRAGANDYFKWPVAWGELLSSVNRHLYPGGRASPASVVPNLPDGFEKMIGESPPMRKIKAYIRNAAATDCNVLITGETGTGKELAAQMLHRHSPRRHRHMVCINCAALPDNLLESELFGYAKGAFTGAASNYAGKLRLAEAGTAFLDEIGEMSPFGQAKILRAIENKEVFPVGGKRPFSLNVRVLASSNQELENLVEQGNFRKDLYFRLNVARINLPPLRERREDIQLLLFHYLQEFNRRFGRDAEGFSDEALEFLLNYDWPGNIRELKNLLEAIFIDLPSRQITILDLPEVLRCRLQKTQGVPRDERAQMLRALIATNWHRSKAAEKLQWSRMTLYRKMLKYNISKSPGLVSIKPSETA